MTIFTAELGANWRGDFDILERMIINCKQAGVYFVKLQALSKDLIDRHPELDYYQKCSVTPDNIEPIDTLCRKHKINWYCTITDINQIDYIKKYKSIAKIRVADSNNKELTDKVFANFGTVFISSTNPMENLPSNAINLYCIAKYPTEFGEINFDMIKRFEGYSNHSRNPLAIFRAIDYGARFIEFHLTDSLDTFAIDNKVSFTYEEMKEILLWAKRSP